MQAQTQAARAETLLAEIKPELLKLLEHSPPFGSCGIEVFFHEGEIVRFSVRAEVSRKPRSGRL